MVPAILGHCEYQDTPHGLHDGHTCFGWVAKGTFEAFVQRAGEPATNALASDDGPHIHVFSDATTNGICSVPDCLSATSAGVACTEPGCTERWCEACTTGLLEARFARHCAEGGSVAVAADPCAELRAQLIDLNSENCRLYRQQGRATVELAEAYAQIDRLQALAQELGRAHTALRRENSELRARIEAHAGAEHLPEHDHGCG